MDQPALSLSIWATVLIVAQLVVAVLGANKDRLPIGKHRLALFFTIAATAVAVIQLVNQNRTAQKMGRLEALAPVESSSGELVFKGAEPGDGTDLLSVRTDGVAMNQIVLRTQKSLIMDRAEAAAQRREFAEAARQTTAALDIDPQFARARSLRAQLRKSAGDFAGANEDASFLLDHKMTDPYYRGVAARILGMRSDQADAGR